MRRAELAKMFELEDSYWWFVARRHLVHDLLVRYRPRRAGVRVVDVGCGTGATLSMLARFGVVTGIDRSADALRYSVLRGPYELVQGRAEELPVGDGSADIVTALDVLEHIGDDTRAVAEFARALRPGGVLLVTVPAGPALWSEHDEALDHVRRYRAAQLHRLLVEAGLEVERLSPVICALLFPVAALRLFQRLRPRRKGRPRTAFIVPPRPVNWLLTALLLLETRWLVRFDLPAGVSLMAVARKK
jgi:SAM-dependent methyltransferase